MACVNNIAGLGMVFISEGLTSKEVKLLCRFSQPGAKRIFFQTDEDRKLFLKSDIESEALTERIPGSGVDLNLFAATPGPANSSIKFLRMSRIL